MTNSPAVSREVGSYILRRRAGEELTADEAAAVRAHWEDVNWRRTISTRIIVKPGGMQIQHNRRGLGGLGVDQEEYTGPVEDAPPVDPLENKSMRGRIKGFSRKSRHRLRNRVAGIPMGRFAADGKRCKRARMFWASPSYHRQWPRMCPVLDGGAAGRVLKGQLDAFWKRFRRAVRCGCGVLWVKAEQEKRAKSTGNHVPHWHLLIVLQEERSVRVVKRLVTDIWCSVSGDNSALHRRYGALCVPVHKGGGTGKLRSYMLQYVSGQGGASDQLVIGRRWGSIGELPDETIGELWLEPEEWEALLSKMKVQFRENAYLQGYERSYSGFISGEGCDVAELIGSSMRMILA
jgi:hypothetical protein